MGAWAAEIFTEHGGIVTTVSDASGALHNPKGLDIVALRRHVAEGFKLTEFKGGASFLGGVSWVISGVRHAQRNLIVSSCLRAVSAACAASCFGQSSNDVFRCHATCRGVITATHTDIEVRRQT